MKLKFNKLELTSREIYFAAAIAVLGFVFSMREFLLFLNTLNPIEGLVVYYIILFASLFVLSKFGLTIFNVKIGNLQQILGLTLLTFSFFIVVGWTSSYIQYVTQGTLEGASVLFYQCEDGAVFYTFNNVLKIPDIEISRLLTYVATPFVLGLVGGLLTTKKLEIKK